MLYCRLGVLDKEYCSTTGKGMLDKEYCSTAG
jgi:hypothetical protein